MKGIKRLVKVLAGQAKSKVVEGYKAIDKACEDMAKDLEPKPKVDEDQGKGDA